MSPSGNDTTFRVYISPPTSASSDPMEKGKDTYLVCHHGAGASGLSFAALAKSTKEVGKAELGVLSFDCRGHGMSHPLLILSHFWSVLIFRKNAFERRPFTRHGSIPRNAFIRLDGRSYAYTPGSQICACFLGMFHQEDCFVFIAHEHSFWDTQWALLRSCRPPRCYSKRDTQYRV